MEKYSRKIDSIMERMLYEEDFADDAEKGLVKIFYNDLDMDGKQKILQAIDESYEYIDVFSDDVIRNKIEESLGKRPIITLSGEEIIHKMDIEL